MIGKKKKILIYGENTKKFNIKLKQKEYKKFNTKLSVVYYTCAIRTKNETWNEIKEILM